MDRPPSTPGTFWTRAALAGAGAWIAGIAWIRPGLAESLLLLGPLVAVPLGLAAAGEPPSRAAALYRLVPLAQLPAALALLASFALPAGNRAALLAIPWLLFTGLVAVLGLRRLVERGPGPIAELAIDGGMLFLPVGGTWPGDTVGSGYRLAPGIDVFFASRVTEVFDGPENGVWRTGFTYRTLAGHPFAGEETFAVEKDMATGAVRAVIRSWSRPEQLLVRLFRPLVRRLQLRAVRRAMEHLGGGAAPLSPPHPRRARA